MIEAKVNELVRLQNEGAISKFITFDEVFEIAKKESFDYHELLYFLYDRGFLIVSER